MASLRVVVQALRAGTTVAFPTESFWALGVMATRTGDIERVFRRKFREKSKPIALVASGLPQVKKFFLLTEPELALAKKYWPGSVTILLKPKAAIAARALGARRIGVRVPAHARARALARLVGVPITATSANESGQPPTKSKHVVARAFPDILQLSGACGRQRRPSTIVQFKKKSMKVLRPGAVHFFG